MIAVNKTTAIRLFLLAYSLSNFHAAAWSPSQQEQSRRGWLGQQGVIAASLLTGSAVISGDGSPALAAGPPSAAELEKLRKGQARVQYLLDHWDEETQVCGKVVMSDMERKQVVRTEGKKECFKYEEPLISNQPW
jgi:hypothetical protein